MTLEIRKEYVQTVKSILVQARDKIEKGWCQHHYAKRADDSVTGANDPQAVKFCMDGAVGCVTIHDRWCEDLAFAALSEIVGPVRHMWNDDPHRTKKEVLAAYDQAIKLVENQA